MVCKDWTEEIKAAFETGYVDILLWCDASIEISCPASDKDKEGCFIRVTIGGGTWFFLRATSLRLRYGENFVSIVTDSNTRPCAIISYDDIDKVSAD